MAEVVEKPLVETPAGRAAAIPPKKALKASASAQGVKIVPGHGVAGRHARRDHLDSLSGHKDPGMFGRMFPRLPPWR
jgi:hypothetical protein